MSVSCECYVGYVVTLKTDLSNDDFNFFLDFMEEHTEYNRYDCDGTVLMVIDGMCGNYARFVFVEKCIKDCWATGEEYFKLSGDAIPDNVYNELNKAYEAMYAEELERSRIDHAIWYHFS